MTANRSEGTKLLGMDNVNPGCGLGGSLSIGHREIEVAMRNKKIDPLKSPGAQVVLSSCPGCTLYLADDIRRKGISLEIMQISRLTRERHGEY